MASDPSTLELKKFRLFVTMFSAVFEEVVREADDGDKEEIQQIKEFCDLVTARAKTIADLCASKV